MKLIRFLLNRRIPKAEIDILGVLLEQNINTAERALSLEEIKDLLGVGHVSYVSRNTRFLETEGIVRAFTKEKKKYLFVPKETFDLYKSPDLTSTVVRYPKSDSNSIVPATIAQSNSAITPEASAVKISPKDVSIKEIYDYYMKTFKKDKRYDLSVSRRAAIAARMAEGYSPDELKRRIDHVAQDEFLMGNNDRGTVYNDLVDIVFNKTKFQKWFSSLTDSVEIVKVDTAEAKAAARKKKEEEDAAAIRALLEGF